MRSLKSTFMSSGLAVLAAACVLIGTTAMAAGASNSPALSKAKKHLLTLADMPKGWEVEKGSKYSTGSSDNFPGAAALAGCIGVPAALITSNPPEEDSPYYQNKSGSLEVQDSVTVFPSNKNAKAQYAAMANAKTPSCFAATVNAPAAKQQIEAGAGAGSSLGTVTVTALRHPQKHTAGFTMTLPITSQGQAISVQETMVFYIKGNLGHQIDFSSYGETFPSSLISNLTSEAKQTL